MTLRPHRTGLDAIAVFELVKGAALAVGWVRLAEINACGHCDAVLVFD